MDRLVESGINLLNSAGQAFCVHAASAFVQSSVLIVMLLVLDVLVRKRVRAVVRYAVWMLVFVKLLLPPTLALPTGIGYYWPHRTVVHQRVVEPFTPMPVEAGQPRPVPMPARPSEVVAASGMAPRPVEMTTSATSLASVRPAIAWQAWVFLAWFVGVLVLCVCLVRRFQYVRKLVRDSTPASDPLQDALVQCGLKLGLRRCPQLRLSDDAPGPVVCRLLSPVVLMPTTLAGKASEDRLRTVLVHELAHIKRADLWVNFVQTLFLVTYFYHPLLWLVNAIVRRLREQAVDETVLVALDAEAGSYSTTLIDLAEMTFHRPILGLRLIGIAESKKALEGRIRHMMTRPKPRTARVGLWGLLTIAVGAAVLLPMASAQRAAETPVVEDATSDSAASDARSEARRRYEDHYISPPALTSLERGFIHQILDLVAEVEEAYPEQATHWPNGPTLFHVDGQGQVTVWRYQRLPGGKTDCAEDEVGYGSSRIVDAEGMYYLPDGAPVPSRWHYRQGGSMHDIRIKVGRVVKPEERVALIHRHRLHDDHDLGSREGRRRSIVLNDFFSDGPVRIVVRVDGPMEANCWVGDATTTSERFDDHELLTVSGPPRDNRGPMLLTVTLPTGAVPDQGGHEATGSQGNLGSRIESRTRLADLGKALLIYANDHDDKFPEHLSGLWDEVKVGMSWLLENVTYLGKDVSPMDHPARVLAYDKTLLATGTGTNVLYLDSHVAFETRTRLEELGITSTGGRTFEARVESAKQLSALGKGLLMYANDWNDKFPNTLQEARDYINENGDFSWVAKNVTYLGQGVSPWHANPARVLAYDKTLLAKGAGTNVLYLDSHVTFESPNRLKDLGLVHEVRPLEEVHRVALLSDLKKLALAAHLYAGDNNDTFPDALKDLEPYLAQENALWVWVCEKVTYVGKAVRVVGGADASKKPLAYCRPGFAAPDEVAVAFQDGHVEFVKGPRLKELGIEIQP